MQHQFSMYEKKNTYLYNTCTSKYKLSNSKVHTLPVLSGWQAQIKQVE